jgi:lipoyl-dependent peroxiredoxin subunit D
MPASTIERQKEPFMLTVGDRLPDFDLRAAVMVGKPGYSEMRAGLRMNRLAQPATNRADFELFSLAVSAIGGCEMCIRAHEKAVTEGGLTPEHVNNAVRIAATLYAAAVSLEME